MHATRPQLLSYDEDSSPPGQEDSSSAPDAAPSQYAAAKDVERPKLGLQQLSQEQLQQLQKERRKSAFVSMLRWALALQRLLDELSSCYEPCGSTADG
jgi:hypothetical protein